MFPVPKAFPEEFRRDVIAVARKGEASIRQVAKDFGISEACLHRWLKIADREDGVDSGGPFSGGDQSAELREAHKRIKLLEQEAEVSGSGGSVLEGVVTAGTAVFGAITDVLIVIVLTVYFLVGMARIRTILYGVIPDI
jgi:transposase